MSAKSSKISFFLSLILPILLAFNSYCDQPLLLVYDQSKQFQILPLNFRDLSTIDLDVIAGGQFSLDQLKLIKKKYPNQKIMIVDLRRESHGFINGVPVSLYGEFNQSNSNKTPKAIIEHEEKFFTDLKKQQKIIINQIVDDNDDEQWPRLLKPKIVEVSNAESEEDLAKEYGFEYKRFAIKDHYSPTKKELDEYIEFINNLPSDTKIYVHCMAGHGRTTTFLTIYDIIKNAKTKTLTEIIARQHELGGADLSKISKHSEIRSKLDKERLKLIKDFYTKTKQ